MSGEGLNAARALLHAGNFAGAQRIVAKVIDDDAESLAAWTLRVEIEDKAGRHKEALKLCRQVLERHPDHNGLRAQEFYILLKLRKKREARKTLERFKQDFPYLLNHIEQMELILDAAHENTRRLSQHLKELVDAGLDPSDLRDFGIAHHKINDLYHAQRLMLKAHESHAGDFELNATLATNSFQLAKPATARKYARLALSADPTDRRMRYLIPVSYLLYFPPFFIIAILFVVFFCLKHVLGKYLAYVLAFFLIYSMGEYTDIFYDLISVVIAWPLEKYSFVFLLVWLATSALMVSPTLFEKVFKNRDVRLKRY